VHLLKSTDAQVGYVCWALRLFIVLFVWKRPLPSSPPLTRANARVEVDARAAGALATRCNTLQWSAACFNTHYNTQTHSWIRCKSNWSSCRASESSCNVLRHTAACTAMHSNVHQHTLQRANAGVAADARASGAIAARTRKTAQGCHCQQQRQTLRWVKRKNE